MMNTSSAQQRERYGCKNCSAVFNIHADALEHAAGCTNERDEEANEKFPYDERVQYAINLLNVVYDRVDSHDFPLPLETYEAGPCSNGQRRYLWTDAFAVMAYQTLAEYYTNKEDMQKANVYHRAVDQLIDVVHDSLGKPRSHRKSNAMKECEISPTKYVGLRIGKPTAKTVTDPSTRYDGQFWHHIDKWLFALVRANHVNEGVRIAKSCFSSFFYAPIRHGGMQYKLSVDGTPPSSDWRYQPTNCYDDTLNALVVFEMLESKNQNKEVISLQTEIEQLRAVVRSFGRFGGVRTPHLRGEHDPIDWGMEAIFDQFVVGHPRTSDHHFRLHAHRNVSVQQYCGRPWLAYGALIGAIVDGTVLSQQTLEDSLDVWVSRQSVRYDPLWGRPQEADRKAGMSRVMLAMALLSQQSVLKRRSDDIMVQIF